MKILLVTPAPPGSHKGNRVTALRWARLLRQLGHRIAVRGDYGGERCDLLIALHARKSAAAVEAYRAARPAAPLIVVLTGTDLYEDIHSDPAARRSLGDQLDVRRMPELIDWRDARQPVAAVDQEPRVARERYRVA